MRRQPIQFLSAAMMGVALLGWLATTATADDAAATSPPAAALTTWDGRHSIDTIRATVVYFVPSDRQGLADWRERAEWLCERLRRFHHREFAGRSRLLTTLHPEPFRSAMTTATLRAGNADATFFNTLREVDAAIDVGRDGDGAFPVLVVLSDINWRPLDDFSRQSPDGGGWKLDGALSDGGVHVPGSAAGGSRAVYLPDRGRGWGLVSGDGWRVPYRGSDCVVYHEGIGHAIGMPHPEPADGSVMSEGQYRSALAQSWIDAGQKRTLGFTLADGQVIPSDPSFDQFIVTPEPAVPRPGQPVVLRLSPETLLPKQLRVELQTSLRGPWITVAMDDTPLGSGVVPLGRFDRPCAVAWRVTRPALPATNEPSDSDHTPRASDDPSSGLSAWGYFQVRIDPAIPPPPVDVDPTDRMPTTPGEAGEAIDLLALVNPARDGVSGEWTQGEVEGRSELLAPRGFGARIELPYAPPEAYRLTLVVEPLDEPHGLSIGLRSGGNRFLALLGFGTPGTRASALENVDGRNVADSPTRIGGDVFVKNRPALIVCTVLPGGVAVTVDGRPWIDWKGDPARLSLSDYWQTPRQEALFLGAYDCRYRFLRVTLEPLAGGGRSLVVADEPSAP